MDVIDDLKTRILSYGVDKTFRYPTDGLLINEEYDVVGKSEDMYVLRLVRKGTESFVVYQFAQDFVNVNANMVNDSDCTIKINPVVVIGWKNNSESTNIVSEVSGHKSESTSSFVGRKFSYYSPNLNEKSDYSEFGLKSGEKCPISAKIRIISWFVADVDINLYDVL